MKKARCSRSYHTMRLDAQPNFAGTVSDGVYTNTGTFTTPPMLQTVFTALISDYVTKRSAYTGGGLAQKGPFLAAKDALQAGLDTMATYVDEVADGDVIVILLGGFTPTKTTFSDAPKPVAVTGLTVKRGSAPGILVCECDRQEGVGIYGCIMTENGPLPTEMKINDGGQLIIKMGSDTEEPPLTDVATGGMIDLNQLRKKEFTNLTAGTRYYFTMYGVNSSGVGPLCDPVSIVCG